MGFSLAGLCPSVSGCKSFFTSLRKPRATHEPPQVPRNGKWSRLVDCCSRPANDEGDESEHLQSRAAVQTANAPVVTLHAPQTSAQAGVSVHVSGANGSRTADRKGESRQDAFASTSRPTSMAGFSASGISWSKTPPLEVDLGQFDGWGGLALAKNHELNAKLKDPDQRQSLLGQLKGGEEKLQFLAYMLRLRHGVPSEQLIRQIFEQHVLEDAPYQINLQYWKADRALHDKLTACWTADGATPTAEMIATLEAVATRIEDAIVKSLLPT